MKDIANLLIRKKITLAIAESCSGGLLSHTITNIPGSSKYFMLGVVAYSNKSKQSLLKIPKKIIKTYGAVSSEVAICMANHIRHLANTNIGIGITGIAGPIAGTKQKPVGTVFISIHYRNKTIVEKFLFNGGRLDIKRKAVKKALQLLKKCLI